MAAKKRSARRLRTRVDADSGVRDCIRRMVSGEWVPSKSHDEVARKHGVSPATVKDWATNASRIIRLLHADDIQELRALSLAQLQSIVARALRGSRPNLKAAIMAIAERNRVLGLATQKLDVTNRPMVSHLTRDEHAAELAKLAEEIAEEQKRIRDGAH